MPERFPLLATAARGTEDLLADELNELGAKKVRQDRGLVRFWANLPEMLHVCLWSRIAMRVLFPLAEEDTAGEDGLYHAAAAIPWEKHLNERTTFAVEASLRDSEHRHSGFVALKIKDAIVDRLRAKLGARPDVDTRDPVVRVVAHLRKTALSVSLDLCGEPLYRRGYRLEPTVAPIKETLAAAILRAAGYMGEEPLVDPMCGSGTFLIEAALIAARRPPALGRSFAIEHWPSLGDQARTLLAEMRSTAKSEQRTPPCPILGMDKDEEAVAATRRNLRAAGVSAHVRVELADALQPPPFEVPPSGLLVANPPYGDRLRAGGQKGMKSFYFSLGERLSSLEGFRKAIVAGNPAFESAFHARPSARRTLWNGPIECQLLTYPARES